MVGTLIWGGGGESRKKNDRNSRKGTKTKRESERIGERLFVGDYKSVLGVLVSGEKVRTLVEECLDLRSWGPSLLLAQDHSQHLCQLRHAVRQSHQSQLVQLL